MEAREETEMSASIGKKVFSKVGMKGTKGLEGRISREQ